LSLVPSVAREPFRNQGRLEDVQTSPHEFAIIRVIRGQTYFRLPARLSFTAKSKRRPLFSDRHV